MPCAFDGPSRIIDCAKTFSSQCGKRPRDRRATSLGGSTLARRSGPSPGWRPMPPFRVQRRHVTRSRRRGRRDSLSAHRLVGQEVELESPPRRQPWLWSSRSAHQAWCQQPAYTIPAAELFTGGSRSAGKQSRQPRVRCSHVEPPRARSGDRHHVPPVPGWLAVIRPGGWIIELLHYRRRAGRIEMPRSARRRPQRLKRLSQSGLGDPAGRRSTRQR